MLNFLVQGAMMGLSGLLSGLTKKGSQTGIMSDQLRMMQELMGEYRSDKSTYSPYLKDTIQYLSQGGSASAANRTKAMAQALAPVNRMIPDVRTRQQNALARAGIVMPGTVGQKMEIDLGTQEAFTRASAIEEVNQRFDRTMDTNRAAAGQLAAAQVAQINNLLATMMGQRGEMATNIAKMKTAEAQQGFDPSSFFASLAGSSGTEFFKSLQGLLGGGGGSGGSGLGGMNLGNTMNANVSGWNMGSASGLFPWLNF